jgi:hypothetical protein
MPFFVSSEIATAMPFRKTFDTGGERDGLVALAIRFISSNVSGLAGEELILWFLLRRVVQNCNLGVRIRE